MCVPKSNSVDQYAITYNVIAYHLVHFFSICVIYKCQSGIDFFFTRKRTGFILWIQKYRHQSSILAYETLQNGWMAIVTTGDTVGLKDHQQQNIFILQIMTSWVMPLSAALNTTRSGQIGPGNSVRATGFGVWTPCVHLASTRVTDSIWSYSRTLGVLCCCRRSFRLLFYTNFRTRHFLPESQFCTLYLIR